MSDSIITIAGSHLTARHGVHGVAGESRLRPRVGFRDVATRYFMRCRDDGYVSALVVYNPIGDMIVFTRAANGDELRWGCRHTGTDEITFFPHPEYAHTRSCPTCAGQGYIGPSKCQECEGSGAQPNQVCLVTEKHVQAERIYLEPTKLFSFADVPILSGV